MAHWTDTHRCAECGQIHCYWCGFAVFRGSGSRSPRLNTATREHVQPRARGGGGGTNIVVACHGCNSARGHSMEWVPFHERGQREMPMHQWRAFQRLGRAGLVAYKHRPAEDRPLDATAV